VTKSKPQTEPSWPTKLRSRFPDGRCIGVDGSVWLYRSVPLAPVVDAVSPDVGLEAATPIMSAFEAMSGMAQVRMARRSASKSSYRQIHVLLVNIPKRFTPPPGALGAYLARSFGDAEVDRRLLLFGVRLRDRVGGGAGPAELQGPGFRRAAGRTGHRLNRAVGSVAQTLSTGTAPLEDFDPDRTSVDEALTRTGLRVPTADEFRLANAWWNHGASPDTVFLEHIDHLHTFTSASSAVAAARLGADGDECSSWPSMANTHSLAFGCVADFELPFVAASDPGAHWAADLLDAGAVCVSIRGLVEPPKVTRHELRRRKKQYLDDIHERADQGKMERAEQEEMLSELSEVEAVYSMEAAPPTIIDCSVLAVFSGRHEVSGYDLSEVCRDSGVVLNSMVSRQRDALAETMLCSNVRSVPHVHDLPAHTIACSGLPSLSVVGDRDGALVGFTERDRQPAWLSPTAAATNDQLPMLAVLGATGSGKSLCANWLADQFARLGRPVVYVDPKALALDTRVPTPGGWTTIKDLKKDDQVFGSDGRPCRVTDKSRVFSTCETTLYELHFDDGQTVTADSHHRWVVYAINDRVRLLCASDEDIARWTPDHLAWAAVVRRLATQKQDSDDMGTYSILRLLRDHGVTKWKEARSMGERLRAAGVLSGRDRKQLLWPAAVALKAVANALESDSDSPYGQILTTEEVLAKGIKRCGQTRFAIAVPSAIELPTAELPIDPYLLGVWLGDGGRTSGQIACGESDLCAVRRLIEAVWPRTSLYSYEDRGLWIKLDRDFERCLYGHSDYIVTKRSRVQRGCATCQRVFGRAWRQGRKHSMEMVNPTFIHLLRKVGVFGNKRIPTSYLRASHKQRLALLQGLMDTDGTVKRRGDLRITMTNKELMQDICELIRSLGYKVSFWEGDATITEADPEDSGRSRIRVVGREWVITFRTPDPVFRLPRKLADQARRCKDRTPIRSRFAYITEVTEVPSQPAQCIRVDSPDHTYLIEDFLVTHNTGSDFEAAVGLSGGQIASLDDLISADGVFDPMRFATRKEAGVEIASSMLLSVNPWGRLRDDWETPLIRALSFGADHGADCIGRALQVAFDAGVAQQQMVGRVFDLATSSPMFRACVGFEPGTTALRLADGITLIRVGDAHLELPEPGVIREASQQQRVGLALVRMMVFGSAMALSMRNGVVMLDEAWMLVSSGGRNEVERLGRLARSQQVLPVLITQRCSDLTNAGLAGYISRGLILPIADPDEAFAACELFQLEPTRERMERMTAKAAIGGTTADDLGAPNWWSMRALRDPVTRRVLRGAVGIYADLSGRAVPVEVRIPDDFLAMASTNPDDIRARGEAEREVATDRGAVNTAASAMVEAVPPVNLGESDPARTVPR
jgi:hypothetical protein